MKTDTLCYANRKLLDTVIERLEHKDGYLKNIFRSPEHFAIIRCTLDKMYEARSRGCLEYFYIQTYANDLADPVHGKEPELSKLILNCFGLQ